MSRKKGLTTGRIPYTARGFLQDAQEAMGTDLVRGLIELITNADDSYARKNASGPIRVEVDHSRKADVNEVMVSDRAEGMSFLEMREKLLPIGGRASGLTEGKDVRGNRGRGAKDLVAFGEVEFTSIKDGRISSVRLRPTGEFAFSRQDDKPRSEDRSRLGIRRGNGTVVTIYLRGVRRPRHEKLSDALTSDFQLRDIMADAERKVILVGRTRQRSRSTTLRYNKPVLEPLLNTTIAVKGHPDTGTIALTVGKLRERSDDGPRVPTRSAGILLAGTRAIYDNTLFKYEGHPIAGWLHGRLDCTYIDRLAKQYDDAFESGDTHPENNPIPIVSRRRRGLAKDHPFWTALSKAVEDQLAPLIERLEEEERSGTEPKESPETRRRLDHLGQAAAKVFHRSLRELDDDNPPTGPLPEIPDTLVILPKQAKIVVGSTKTLSVVCDAKGLREGDEVTVELDPEGVFEIVNKTPVRLGPHRSGRSDVLTAPTRIKALRPESALLEASIGERTNLALLDGISEPPPPPPINPPEDFKFENTTYSIGINKRKSIELWAPAALAKPTSKIVQVTSDNEGVTVLDGGTTTMLLNEEQGFYVATIRIAGSQLGAKATLYANLEEHTARSQVNVVSKETGIPDLRIRLTPNDVGSRRAYFEPPEPGPDGQTLWVAIKHPSLLPLIKKDRSGEHTPEFRTALAEVVAEALAAQLVKKEHDEQPIEATTLYHRHAQQLTKILPVIQKVLI
ncbi:MAG: ATP-binding protein [Acidimicrobiia bacterium]|nr:ATP-binding protein [Acidimicrobiia bacterium]